MSTENDGSNTDETMVRDSQPTMAAMAGSDETSTTTTQTPQTEGKRTQLKIVRENIQTLSGDIGNFRRTHENSTKKLEAQIASIRKDLAEHTRSKELASHAKSADAANKALQKQVASLKTDLAAMKAGIARDSSRARAKQEATLARILAKVSVKAKTVSTKAKTVKAKVTKKKR